MKAVLSKTIKISIPAYRWTGGNFDELMRWFKGHASGEGRVLTDKYGIVAPDDGERHSKYPSLELVYRYYDSELRDVCSRRVVVPYGSWVVVAEGKLIHTIDDPEEEGYSITV